ncbi:MAG TPA: amidohydrolase family protein [Acidimicrobiales bacterium]|nr:amidohydrolase family protein [Acidimicrobiales bacterium]
MAEDGGSGGGGSPYLVVAADSHVGPRLETFRPYCPRRHLDAFEEQVRQTEAQRAQGMSFKEVARRSFGYTAPDELVRAADEADLVAGGHDPEARRRDMDADGVAADVIFHGLQNGEPLPLVAEGLFQSAANEPGELDPVGYHMYNQWLVDFISGAPERHAALAYVSFNDIDQAVDELTWAAEAGLRGVNFPAPKRGRPDYTSRHYDRFFAACADLDMALTTHNGAGDRWRYDDGVLSMAFQKIEGPFVARRGVWQLIFSQVFERYPGLKMVLTELIHHHWIEEMLREMDFAAMDPSNPAIRGRLARLPSEVWATNFYVGASMLSADEAALYPDRGTAHLMWGSDYPHVEGTFPHTRASLRQTFAGLPESVVRPMAGLTAAAAYGLDPERLQPVADRIGPTPAELSTPPEATPGDDEYFGFGFRRSTAWPAAATAGR